MSGTHRAAACGKVILLGEHVGVYQRAALAAGLDGALRTEARRNGNGRLHLSVPHWSLQVAEDQDSHPAALLRLLRRELRGQQGAQLDVQTWLPPGAGLGSSAALSVGLVRVLAEYWQRDLSEAAINLLAFAAEGIFHGRPSGLDNTTAAYGGLCLLNGEGRDLPPAFEPLPGEPTRLRRCTRPLRLALADSRVQRSTRIAVDRVRELGEADPEAFAHLLDRINALTHEGAQAVVDGDLPALGVAMNLNQEYLRRLGVSHPRLELAVEEALAGGALGAKLTGAGLGGCVVALLPAAGDQVLQRWRQAGFNCWEREAG
ncbi:MAG: mevalonate kinase [Deltaproteobacteria bacterium]|nr:mevalonate kinase [Deltaproteobacteria bacterium]